MKRILPIAVAVLFAGCFGGFQPRDKSCPEIEAIPGEPTMLAIGDSIFAWRNQRCRTVPDIVALELQREVEHAAVNGARISGGDHDIASQYVPADWSWVIMDGGGNDLNNECECGVDCDETLDALVSEDGSTGQIARLADLIVEDGSRVLLFGYYEVSPDASYGFDECIEEIDELRARQERLADAREQVTFVDGRDAVTVAETPEAYARDDVHPSPEGARLVGELIAERIAEAEQ